MAGTMKVWFDKESDFLEVRFSDVPGSMRATEHDSVMERVDTLGNVVGFSILGVQKFTRERPLIAELNAT